MRNVWMLAKANLRKSKSQTFTLFLLIVIAAMFLNIGLVVFTEVGTFFDERAEELNTPHFISVQPEGEDIIARTAFIRNFPGVYAVESQDVLRAFGGFYADDTLVEGFMVISRADSHQTMNPPSLIGYSRPLVGNAVYIPHFMFLRGGFAVGDEFRLVFSNNEISLTVAGSTEEIMMGIGANNDWRIYVSDSMFQTLAASFSNVNYTMTAARMTEGWASLTATYRENFGGGADNLAELTMHYGMASSPRTTTPTIAAMMIALVAFILLIVGSITVRFRIGNDIEENMVNIGALKAVGYRNRHIVLSIIFQFGIIALVGSIIGVLVALASLPVISGILEPMLALLWNPSLNIVMTIAATMLVLFMVLLFAWVTSRRINKLHPLIALRSGITTHNFKKNPLPLDKARANLSLLLAAKQFLRNKKQAVMLCIIVGALTFASVAGLTLHYNVNVDITAFFHTIAGETADLAVAIEPDDAEISDEFRARIASRPDVASIFGFAPISLTVDGDLASINIVQDFSYLAGHNLIRGRLPLLPGEIVLDTPLLSNIGKGIGDWVTVRSGEVYHDFIVTGIVQGQAQGMMNLEAVRKVQPDYNPRTFYVNLTTGTNIDSFIESMEATEGEILVGILIFQEELDRITEEMGSVFASVNTAILLAVVFVVVLVLFLVVKTMIIRRRRELGIQKALGFTTLQLMNQMALGITPTIIIGALLGAISGYLAFNPVFVMIMSGAGIAQADLPVPISWIVILSTSLVLLAYAMTMLISWRIRKISAYALVTE